MTASFTELLFLFHCLGVFALIIAELWMVFNFKKMSIQWGILAFISFILVWFMGFMVAMTEYSVLYSIIFKFNSLMFLLNVFFFIALILFNVRQTFLSKEINPYSPEK